MRRLDPWKRGGRQFGIKTGQAGRGRAKLPGQVDVQGEHMLHMDTRGRGTERVSKASNVR